MYANTPEPEAHYDYTLQQAMDEPEIDVEIKPMLKEMWQKVAPTCASCSGHGGTKTAYVAFKGHLTEGQMKKAQDIADKYGYGDAVFRRSPPVKDATTEMSFGGSLEDEDVGYVDDDGVFSSYVSRPIVVKGRKRSNRRNNPDVYTGLRGIS